MLGAEAEPDPEAASGQDRDRFRCTSGPVGASDAPRQFVRRIAAAALIADVGHGHGHGYGHGHG
jgi:hypothetical protein